MYNARLNYKVIVVLCTALLQAACADNNGKLRYALDVLDSNRLITGSYVIIPDQGCEGCISTAEAFVKKHVGSADSIRYIFTRIQSLKLLKIKLGSEVMSSSKILLDTGNMIGYPDKGKEIYPMIITVKDRKIDKVTYQSPEDDGLSAVLRH